MNHTNRYQLTARELAAVKKITGEDPGKLSDKKAYTYFKPKTGADKQKES